MNPDLTILIPVRDEEENVKIISNKIENLAYVVSAASKSSIPVPCLSSTLDYLNGYRTNRLPQNLVQAMRDCFGSHTYQRIDREGSFHTDWIQ